MDEPLELAIAAIKAELVLARKNYGAFNSAHEGWAVIYEEMRELETEVFKNPQKRSNQAMRDEAIQVAAMAIRFVLEVCVVRNNTI